MSLVYLFAILVLASVVQTRTIVNSCATYVSKVVECRATISFSGDCYSPKVNLSNTEYSKCIETSFFWSYPVNNMTLIIETPYTQQRKQYTLYFDNSQMMNAISHVYRIFNNQEIEVTTRDQKLIQYSDANYQVILKFQGPPQLSFYGVNINYQAVPMF